jgi:hypothetical protein
LAPCKEGWCGPCYKKRGNIKYAFRIQINDDGEEILQPGEEDRFLVARAGDHLMVPFQYKTCHFRNIYQRNPERMLTDEEALEFIWDANMNAFWGREESTVSSNL